MDKEQEINASLWTVLIPQSVCTQTGARDIQQVSLAEEPFTLLQFACAYFMAGKAI